MDVGEILTGGRVSCHDGCVHVAALVRPFCFLVMGRFGVGVA